MHIDLHCVDTAMNRKQWYKSFRYCRLVEEHLIEIVNSNQTPSEQRKEEKKYNPGATLGQIYSMHTIVC